MSFCACVMMPALLLLGLEAGLRLFGFGYPTAFFLRGDDSTLITNPKFGRQFFPRATATAPHPVMLSASKAPGATRIFLLGESAAMGTPDPSFGFGRILEAMLRERFPERKFEVVNAAMRGVNSHIIRRIAQECAQREPDLFILYMGNNETIGLHAPEPRGFHVTKHLWLLRTIQAIKRTKIGQAVEALAARGPAADPAERPKQTMDYFRAHRLAADHPRRQAVYDNFKANLDDICEAMEGSGAKSILCTVAVNLKDFPPLASLHRENLSDPERAAWESAYQSGIAAEAKQDFDQALRHYGRALEIDRHFADLHFRLARCHFAKSEFAKAREHYALARDWDALQFRTDSRLNAIIRERASRADPSRLRLHDAERLAAASPLSEQGIPGRKIFTEHVHFTFDGDHWMASALFPAVCEALELNRPGTDILPRDRCAELLAFTPWDELNVTEATVRLTANPPFLDQLEHSERQAQAEAAIRQRFSEFKASDLAQAAEMYRGALGRRPDDWQLHYNFAHLLADLKDHAAAAEEMSKVVALLPCHPQMRFVFGTALARAGKLSEAAAVFREAVRLDPEEPAHRQALAWAEAQLQRGRGPQVESGAANAAPFRDLQKFSRTRGRDP